MWSYSEKFKIRIYQNSLNSNHIHMAVYTKNQEDLHNFLRVLAGQIAQRITNSVRGKKLKCSFWLKSVWGRSVEWGRDFKGLINYIFQNQVESLGLKAYKPRGKTTRSRPLKITPIPTKHQTAPTLNSSTASATTPKR